MSAWLSVIPELQNKIELMGHSNHFDIQRTEVLNKKSGSKILYRGINTSSGNQTAKLKSIEGLSTFVLDEAEEVPDEKDFDTINFSIRSTKVKNRAILILNPTTKESWIYKRFFEETGVNPGFNGINDRVLYIHTSFLDNTQNLSDMFLLQAKRLQQNNPDKYRHIIMGGWLDKAEGVIYENWQTGETDMSIDPVYGLDFGFSYSPDALVEVRVDNKRKKIYAKELLYKNGLTTDQLAKLIDGEVSDNGLIIADSAEPRLIHELRQRGLNIRQTVKKHGSVLEGIRLIQDYEMIVEPSSINLIRELNNYQWDDKKAEKPVDAFNHILDGVRYTVSHMMRPAWVSI
jgi:phage terminase large subunit